MDPFEALYGQRYRSPIGWFEPSKAKLYGTDMVKYVLKKVKLIQERLRIAQSRQKNYADHKARDVSFMVSEKVLLNVSPMKVHLVFHVSMLRKYHADLSHMLYFSTIQLYESLGYEEEPVAIVDRQDRQLRSKRISAAKVQWRGQPVEEATWESKEDMRSRYPCLFSTSGMNLNPFEDERSFKRWRM
ncbi:uncharacterized protein [Nicotiana sylvestris]|uniref:uncharacterized protein n=1 Tax=Nicotiana sylvestris TaxID=4096 RepID=UPI00388C9B6C